MKIYLDVCCLNRPFDDQTQDRIHLESEAVITILKNIETGKWHLVNSDAIFFEIDKIPDREKKSKIYLIMSKSKSHVQSNKACLLRAGEIQKLGIKSYDALHVASAEKAHADIFLTTDDDLLAKLKKHTGKIKIRTENPLTWIEEVI